MACISNIKSDRGGSGRSTVRLALSALLMLGAGIATAGAQGRPQDGHHDDQRNDHHDDHRNWNGGYYPAPPVVYGTPYYAPPPVVYGPSIGIVLPGIVVGVQ
jgi:hypothetical protein